MIEYINQKKKKYYLLEGKTKTGKVKYYFSTKKSGKNVAVKIIKKKAMTK